MMALLKKNLVPIVIVAAAAGVLYYFFVGGGETPLLSTDEEAPVSQELVVTLGSLRTIKLDDTVFRDPLFLSLSDFGVTIPPAAAGRRNPFAPVGQGGSVPSQPATTTSTTTPR